MNSTFKVVFNKARGALMVVNEVTSSVQAKGTKTVVATAVAAMIAGVAGTAMAAATVPTGVTANDVLITNGGSVTVTGAAAKADAAETVVDGSASTTAWVASGATVTLSGDDTVRLKDGAFTVKATDTVSGSASVKDIQGNGTVNVTAGIGATDAAALGSTLNLANGNIGTEFNGGLTLVFDHLPTTATATKAGVSKIATTDLMTLGTEGGDDRFQNETVVTLDVVEGAKAVLQATKVNFDNVKFANKGDLTVSGAAVFNSAYDGTAADNSGKLTVTGQAKFNDTFISSVVLVGPNGSGADEIKGVQTQVGNASVGANGTLVANELYVTSTTGGLNALASDEKREAIKAEKTTVKGSTIYIMKNAVANLGEVTLNNGTLNAAGGEAGVGTINAGTINVEGASTLKTLASYAPPSGTDRIGTITAEALNVVGSVDATAGTNHTAALTVNSRGLVAVKDAITVGGPNTSATGTLTLNSDTTGTLATEDQYNLTAGSLAVNANGTVSLTNGKVNVGAVTVQKGATLSSATYTLVDLGHTPSTGGLLVVDGEMNLAKESAVTLDGKTKVGSLINAADARIVDLTVKEGQNTGTISADTLTVKGGEFVNTAVTNTTGVITNSIKGSTADVVALSVNNGAFTNNGKAAVSSLELTNGATVTTALYAAGTPGLDKTANMTVSGDITVAKESTLALTDYNSYITTPSPVPETPAYDQLTLSNNVTLDNGFITVKNEKLDGKTVTIADSKKFEVNNRDDFKVGTLNLAAADSQFVIGAKTDATVGTLDAKAADSTVTVNGKLTATDKVYTNATHTNFTVANGGELVGDASVFGLVVEKSGADYVLSYKPVDDTVGHQSWKFEGIGTNNGTITVNNLTGTIKHGVLTGATTHQAKFGLGADTTGLVYLNGLEVDLTGLLETDKTITTANANKFGGIVVDATKALTVTSDGSALLGEFKDIKLTTGTTQAAGNILKLNGSGSLITYKDSEGKEQLGGVTFTDGTSFVYAGGETAGDVGVVGAGTSYGLFVVQSGTLNAKSTAVKAIDARGGSLKVAEGISAQTFAVANGAAVEVAKKGVTVASASTIEGKVDVLLGDYTQTAGNLDVKETGALTVAAGDVAAGAAINVAGELVVGAEKTVDGVTDVTRVSGTALNVTGTAKIAGEVVTDSVAVNKGGYAEIAKLGRDMTGYDVAVTVGNDSGAGTLVVGELVNGTIFADPTFGEDGTIALEDASNVAVGTAAAGTQVHAGRASIASIGTTDTTAAIKALQSVSINELEKGDIESVLYVVAGETTYAGNVRVDGASGASTSDGLYVDANSLAVIDGRSAVQADGALFAQKVEVKGDVLVADAVVGDIALSAIENGVKLDEEQIYVTNDRILGAELNDGVITVAVLEGNELAQMNNAVTIETIKDYYAKGLNNGSAWFEGMMTRNDDYPDDAAVVTALNDVAAVGATAGMAAVTMDALSAFNDTVAARTSILAPNAEGTTVWADVNGGRYEAKKLMNGAGYSSDIYAGVIGVDTTVACGAKIGAALTVGTADTDSQNTTAVTSMDSDFFGLSVYTAKAFGNANVAVDFGYMQGSNDVDVKAYNLGKFSADSDAFTLGVRGELLLKAGDFNVVPHVGLRWTRLSVDDFTAGYTADLDTMNVFQLPFGVTVAGEFDAAGWTLAPAFDLTVVPAFGDKDQEMKLGLAGANVQATNLGVQVIDSNPVQATLGLDAVNGAWAFGLSYKLGVGTDSRMNNSFNANVRYTF